jgi:hypothetical protein
LPVDGGKMSATYYQIEIAGSLDRERAEWLGNMALAVMRTDQGSTITSLTGPVPDRAALFGILNRIRDLGLRLISVNPVEPGAWAQ